MKVEATIHFGKQQRRKVVCKPKPPVVGRTPRISKLMALAIKMQRMVDEGEVEDYAQLARLAQVTRARMTQIMNLNLLSPAIQEQLLFLPRVENGHDSLTLKEMQGVCLQADWEKQSIDDFLIRRRQTS